MTTAKRLGQRLHDAVAAELGSSAMSEPTEQIAERDRNNALMITNLQAEVDRLTIDRDAWRLTARTFERASAAAPRQASAMSAEADRIHVRLLAMGWLDHREDNCKTATEAAKLIRELSEESAPRQADGWREPVTYLVNEVRGMLSAYEHELRHYMGHTNYNCIAERLPAVEALLRPADEEQKS